MRRKPCGWILMIIGLVCLAAWEACGDTYPRQLALHVDHYTFRITLTDGSNEITGMATVSLHFLASGLSQFELDLVGPQPGGRGMTVTSVTSHGQPLHYRQHKNRLRIDLPSASHSGQFGDYTIRYHGVPAAGLLIGPNRYGDRSFDTNNWPDKVRNWLPCIDHPYNKATVEMIVTAPAHYQVISNGRLLEQTDLPGNRRRSVWKESVPIATWLVALAAAPFAVQYLGRVNGVPVETWVYPQERQSGFKGFALYTRPILEFYTNLIAPFPFEKLANVEANGTRGGMELASDIFYGYAPRFITTLGGQQLIAHEMAHQWFGDSVTESDWDDVWLSEGFATYFALVYLKHADGHDAFVAALNKSRNFILNFSASHPGYTVVHNNISDLHKLLTNQIYQKGAWTLHMLHDMLGGPIFWQGMREYYDRYKSSNASTADFEHVMEQVSGKDLSWFFREWLNEGGTLNLEGSWHYNAASKQLEIQLNQTQKGPLFQMPIPVAIYGGKEPKIETVDVKSRQNDFTVPLEKQPASVVLDPSASVLMEAKFEESK